MKKYESEEFGRRKVKMISDIDIKMLDTYDLTKYL